MSELQRVFLSHNSNDKEWARALAEALAIELDADSFLDERSIQLGERWDLQIQEAIERCPVALVLLGANGWGPVHRIEAMMALERARRDLTFRFVPVLLPGVDAEAQRGFADGKVFDEIHRMDLSALLAPGQLADPASEPLIAGLRLMLTGKVRVDARELTPFLLRRDAMRWDANQRSPKLLYSDARLEVASTLLDRMGELGIPVMREYVEAGRKAKEKRQRVMLGAAMLLAGAMIVLTLIAYRQTLQAQARARAAEALTAPLRYFGLKSAIELSKDSSTAEALAAPFVLLANIGAAERIFHGSTRPITSLATHEGIVYAGTNGGEVWRWQGATARKMTILGASVSMLQPCGEAVLAGEDNGDLVLIKRDTTLRIWIGSAKPSADGYGEIAAGGPGANAVTAGLQFEGSRALVFDLSGAAWWIDCRSGKFRSAGSVPFKEVRHATPAGGRVLGATGNGRLFLWRPETTTPQSVELRIGAVGIQWTSGNRAYALDAVGTVYRWNAGESAATAVAAISATPLRAFIDAEASTLWMSGLNGAVMRCTWEEPAQGDRGRPNAPHCKALSAEPVHHRVVSAIVRDSLDGLVSASADGSVVAWADRQVNRLIRVAPAPPRGVGTLALASTDWPSIIYQQGDWLVRYDSGQERWRISLSASTEHSACVSRDRRAVLVTAQNGELSLLDAATGRELGRWPGSEVARIAAAIDDGFVVVPIHGGPVTHFSGTGVRSAWGKLPVGELIGALAARARGRMVAAGRLDGVLQLSSGGAAAVSVKAHAGPVFALDISSDGRRLMSGAGAGEPGVKMWSTSHLEHTLTLPAEHEATLAAARFHPLHNDLAATADDRGLVVLWDLATQRARGRIRLEEDDPIDEIEFGATGNSLAYRSVSAYGLIAVGPEAVRQVMQQVLVTTE